MFHFMLAAVLAALPSAVQDPAKAQRPARSSSPAAFEWVAHIQTEGSPEAFLERTLLEHKLRGDHELALAKLRALRLGLGTGQGKRPNLEWVTKVITPQFELLMRLGRWQEAEKLLSQPIPSEAELRGVEGIRADIADGTQFAKALTASWRGSSMFTTLTGRLESLQQEAEAPAYLASQLQPWALEWLRAEVGYPDEAMVEATRQLLAAEGETSQDIWRPFLPSLSALAFLESQGKSRILTRSAYRTLLDLDDSLGAKLTLQALPRCTALWRREVIDALPIKRGNSDDWISLGPWTASRQYYEPLWIDVLAELYERDPTDATLRGFLRIVCEQRGYSPRLQEILKEQLRTGGSASLVLLLSDLSDASADVDLIVTGLENPHAEVQESCVALLRALRAQDALAQAVSNGIPSAQAAFVGTLPLRKDRAGEVARDLATQLLKGEDRELAAQVAKHLFDEGSEPDWLHFESAYSSRFSEVAESAIGWLLRSKPTEESCLRLAQDERPWVRARFLSSSVRRRRFAKAEVLLGILEAALADPDPSVRGAFDSFFVSADSDYYDHGLGNSDARRLLLERLRRSPDTFSPFGGSRGGWRSFIRVHGRDLEGNLFLLEVASLTQRLDCLDAGLTYLANKNALAELQRLDPQVVRYVALQSPRPYFPKQLSSLRLRGMEDMLDSIAGDRDVHPYRRLWALGRLPFGSEGNRSKWLMEVLRQPGWESGELQWPTPLRCGLPQPAKEANVLLRRVLADSPVSAAQPVTTAIQSEAVAWFDGSSEDAVLTAELALAWWNRKRLPYRDALHDLLINLPTGNLSPRLQESLFALLKTADLYIVDAALDGVRGARLPGMVRVLGEVLENRDLQSGSSEARNVLRKVSRALAATGQAEALAYLRRGLLLAADETTILEIESAISRLELYLANEEGTPQGLPTRTAAEAQLIEMLQSPSEAIRIEAIRGLGTLGALEALPVLIPLLEDESDRIKAAARYALERLHGDGEDK